MFAPPPEISPASDKRYVPFITLLLVYLGIFIAATVLAGLILSVLSAFVKITPSSSVTALLIPLASAMGLARFWAKREGLPSKLRRILVAVCCAALTAAIAIIQLLILTHLLVLPLKFSLSSISTDDFMTFRLIGAIILVLMFVMIRAGFWLIFNVLENEEKKQAENWHYK